MRTYTLTHIHHVWSVWLLVRISFSIAFFSHDRDWLVWYLLRTPLSQSSICGQFALFLCTFFVYWNYVNYRTTDFIPHVPLGIPMVLFSSFYPLKSMTIWGDSPTLGFPENSMGLEQSPEIHRGCWWILLGLHYLLISLGVHPGPSHCTPAGAVM